MTKHPIRQLVISGVVAGAIGVVVVLAIHWFPPQASTAAKRVDRLYYVAAVASVLIFALVMTVAIYSVWRFRARPGDDEREGEPIHGNSRLEVTWVVIPFLILVGLGVYAALVLRDNEAPQASAAAASTRPADPAVIDVTAQQFSWSFRYPVVGGQPVVTDHLMLAKGRQTEIRLSSLDVVHAFWVPEFRLQEDAVPGITTTLRVTPSRDGNYDLICAELCGLGHSAMRAPVTVLDGPAFDAWLAGQRANAAQSPTKG